MNYDLEQGAGTQVVASNNTSQQSFIEDFPPTYEHHVNKNLRGFTNLEHHASNHSFNIIESPNDPGPRGTKWWLTRVVLPLTVILTAFVATTIGVAVTLPRHSGTSVNHIILNTSAFHQVNPIIEATTIPRVRSITITIATATSLVTTTHFQVSTSTIIINPIPTTIDPSSDVRSYASKTATTTSSPKPESSNLNPSLTPPPTRQSSNSDMKTLSHPLVGFCGIMGTSCGVK